MEWILYKLTPLVPSARQLVLLERVVAVINSMRIGSGFLLIPQRPEAVLVQLKVYDAALFSRRHTDRKKEA